MTPSADQLAAFQANGGFSASAVSALLLGAVFAVLLLWGVWAMRTAYVGWAEHRITERQFLAVVERRAGWMGERQRRKFLARHRMATGKTTVQVSWWNGYVPRIARVSGQCFLDAFLDGFDSEMAADCSPAASSECFENDIGVSEYPGLWHTNRASQLERCGEIVLSE